GAGPRRADGPLERRRAAGRGDRPLRARHGIGAAPGRLVPRAGGRRRDPPPLCRRPGPRPTRGRCPPGRRRDPLRLPHGDPRRAQAHLGRGRPSVRRRTMSTPGPILVSPLFRELDGHLLHLLRTLTPEDWHRPTVCSAWCVKDIASHLLDGGLRRLSTQRDGYTPPGAPAGFESHEALAAYLHRLNADWTGAPRRPLPPPRTLPLAVGRG